MHLSIFALNFAFLLLCDLESKGKVSNFSFGLFSCPYIEFMQIAVKSTDPLRGQCAFKYFSLNFAISISNVILKIRSRSPKLYQIFAMSMY